MKRHSYFLETKLLIFLSSTHPVQSDELQSTSTLKIHSEDAPSLNKSTRVFVPQVFWNRQAARFYCLGVLKGLCFQHVFRRSFRQFSFYSVSPCAFIRGGRRYKSTFGSYNGDTQINQPAHRN